MGRAAVAVFLVSVAGWSDPARAVACPTTGKPNCGVCGTLTCDTAEGFWYCDPAPKFGVACNDGNACTYNDQCSGGKCVGTPITCANTACSTQSCNGTSQCTIAPFPSGTHCREPAGPCDTLEVCDGTSTACPADLFQSSTVLCRAAIDLCDAPEYCTGTSAACPPDLVQPAQHVCRAAAGPCDVAETCNGTTNSCPPDQFMPNTFVCRPAVGPCDVAEKCTAASAACPADGFATNGTECNDAMSCTSGDSCQNGVCSGTAIPNCTNPCAGKIAGTACDDGHACTYNDQCDGAGGCRGTTIACTPRGECETASCNGTSSCTYTPLPAQSACPSDPVPCEKFCTGTPGDYTCHAE